MIKNKRRKIGKIGNTTKV